MVRGLRGRFAWMAVGLCCWTTVGCGAQSTVSVPKAKGSGVSVSGHSASCAAQTADQQDARAQVIADVVALPGRADPRDVLLSPARFTVIRYLKGRGPQTVRVQTAVSATPAGGYSYNEDGIAARAGQRWRVYGTRTSEGTIATGICSGSRVSP